MGQKWITTLPRPKRLGRRRRAQESFDRSKLRRIGMHKTIRNWKKYTRHPLSEEYADWPSDQRESVTEKMRQAGRIIGGSKITLFEGMILDGWQRFQCALAAGITPEFQQLARGVDPVEFV